MEIILNGEKREIIEKNLLSFIENEYSDFDGIVVTINDNIIRKEYWKSTNINSGDIVEILKFVGGG